jgi:hypothetical protein
MGADLHGGGLAVLLCAPHERGADRARDVDDLNANSRLGSEKEGAVHRLLFDEGGPEVDRARHDHQAVASITSSAPFKSSWSGSETTWSSSIKTSAGKTP